MTPSSSPRNRVGSLCTGIGGLDLAVERHFGAEMAWYSEIELAPCRVLEEHWFGVENLGDLTLVDWSNVEPVDIITAGYPCQPFSHAGKRKGKSDVRHLWPFVADAIRHLRPRYVVLENVAGHLSLGFGDVLGDLAEAGFDAEWCVLRASDVGAPHARARLFVVARNTDEPRTDPRSAGGSPRDRAGEPSGAAPDADGEPAGRNGGAASRPQEPDAGRGAANVGDGPADGGAATPDAADERHERRRDARRRRHGSADDRGTAPDTDSEGARRSAHEQAGPVVGGGAADDDLAAAWGPFELAVRRWEAIVGRPAPRPIDDSRRLSPHFVEWMMGYRAGWVTDLDLGRTASLKALGNAVVTQQASAALRELLPVFGAAPNQSAVHDV